MDHVRWEIHLTKTDGAVWLKTDLRARHRMTVFVGAAVARIPRMSKQQTKLQADGDRLHGSAFRDQQQLGTIKLRLPKWSRPDSGAIHLRWIHSTGPVALHYSYAQARAL